MGAEHLAPLAGGWSVWRDVCVRSAGFPIDGVGALRAPELDGEPDAEAFARAQRSASETLRRWAADDRFREAITWQNRSVLSDVLDALLRKPLGASDFKTRRRELVVASYLQRYCTKNDTIGFFGPIGWGRLEDGEVPIVANARTPLLDRRTVRFEHWAVDTLATTFSADPALRLHIPPRRSSGLRVEGDRVHYPVGRSAVLPRPFLEAIALSDGTRSAIAIARALALSDEEEGLDVLEQLATKQLICWRIAVPTGPVPHLRWLVDAIAALPPIPERHAAETTLAELSASLEAVAQYAGRPTNLREALDALDVRFVAATGAGATRRHGQTYAGRTLAYEDCRRNVTVTFGRSVRERVAAPLALVCASLRWYTAAIAVECRRVLSNIYRELCEEGAGPRVDYLVFWNRVAPLFSTDALVSSARSELQNRWAGLLSLGARASTHSSAALAESVERVFAADRPGWPSARYHAPDILLCGDGSIVLGEVHVAAHTFLPPFFLREHPTPEALICAREIDITHPLFEPVISANAASRADFASPSMSDFDIEIADTPSWRPRSHVLPAGELVVEEHAGRLVVGRRDSAFSCDLIAFLDGALTAASHCGFDLLPKAAQRGRVTIDDVVLARERWCPPPEDLAFANAETPFDRFVGARAFRQRHGLPRLCFFKTPTEPKPCFVDFESPTFVEMFARHLRRVDSVVLTEMLPTPDQCWLPDASGQRYASELRLAVVDPCAYEPEQAWG
jgi:hypothetical protein